MGVFSLHNHSLTQIVQTEGYEDERGDYYEGKDLYGITEYCNAVPSGKASEIAFQDGVSRKYSFVCNMLVSCRDYSLGERVRLQREGLFYELEVVGFIRYQTFAKVYIG